MDIRRVMVKKSAIIIFGDTNQCTITFRKNQTWYVVGETDELVTVERECANLQLAREDYNLIFEERSRSTKWER